MPARQSVRANANCQWPFGIGLQIADVIGKLQQYSPLTKLIDCSDGNLHLNISVPTYAQPVLDLIEPYVFEFVGKHKGSISAEHGEIPKKVALVSDPGHLCIH